MFYDERFLALGIRSAILRMVSKRPGGLKRWPSHDQRMVNLVFDPLSAGPKKAPHVL